MPYRLTPAQFAVVMTVLWFVAIAATVPLTFVTVVLVLLVGLTATPLFFYSLANFVLDYMPLAEAKFNERFTSND